MADGVDGDNTRQGLSSLCQAGIVPVPAGLTLRGAMC